MAARLGVPVERIEAWRSAGMPSSGSGARRRFDPASVREWLLAHGHGRTAAPREVVHSLEDVASALGVSSRAVQYWRRQGMPTTDDGRYDLAAVREWRESVLGGPGLGERSVYETQLSRLRVEEKQLELAERRGRLLDARLVNEVLERAVRTARAILERLPDRVLGAAGEKLPDAERQRIHDTCGRLVETALDQVSSATLELAEEFAAQDERREQAGAYRRARRDGGGTPDFR